MRRSIRLLVAAALIVAACTVDEGGETTTSMVSPTIEPSPVSTTTPPSTTSTTSTTLPDTSSSNPPGETTQLASAVLAGNRIEPELSCDDIAELGGSYAEAVAYWIVEGRPNRMDADGNGIPCETVYSSADVDTFYSPDGVEMSSGRFCRDLAAEELPLSYAVAYWLLEGAPPRMDADGNGVPCETVYPAEDFDAFFPIVSRWQSFTNSNNIVDLAVAPDGTVWTVGHGGAVHWDPESGAHRKYAVEDGLTSNAVNGIAIADDGTVWLATRSGASSFDGEAWRRYLPEEPFYSVLPTSDGRVWLGGSEVIVVLDDSDTTRFTYEDGLSTEIRSLAEDSDGAIYATTGGCCCEDCVRFHGGEGTPDVLTLRDGRWQSTTQRLTSEQPPGNSSFIYGGSDLMIAPDGVLWTTGYEPNLMSFDGTTWTGHIAVPPGTSEADWFYAATIDANGHIWASGRNSLLRFDGEAAEAVPSPGEARLIRSLAVDDNSGVLWAGTWEGLTAYENGTWMWYRTDDAIQSNYVKSLAAAEDLWVGTSGGLSRHSAAGWETIDRYVLAGDPEVGGHGEGAIAIAPDGTVWVGAGGGISRFDGTRWYVESQADYYPPLAVDSTGAAWAIEYGQPLGDLARLKDGAWVEHAVPDECRGASAMAFDADDTLWTLGWCSTLCSFDGAAWTTHFEGACWDPIWEPEPDVAYPGNVLAMTIDPSGRPLISTDQAGLLLWDGASWVPVDETASALLAADALIFGSDGSLWVLESEGAPHRAPELQFDPSHRYVLWQRSARGEWRSVPSAHLTNVWPNVLAVDNAGALWIGTLSGLLRYVPSIAMRGK